MREVLHLDNPSARAISLLYHCSIISESLRMSKHETDKKHDFSAHHAMRVKIVHAALALADQIGWDIVTLADIASECEMSLAELHMYVADKGDVLCALGRLIDAQVLEGIEDPDPSATPKERLFDVMMDRYEVLNDYRAGVIAIMHSFKYDPKQALITMPHLCRSMNWMMEAADVQVRGFKGAFVLAGMSGLYLKVLKTWMEDESPDLSKTMAALDTALAKAEKLAEMIGL